VSLNTVHLIDASIYIFRAYFAIPNEWFCPRGLPVNALYGYTRFILQFLQQTKTQQIAVAYDESLGTCFRNDIYPEYKSSRVLPDDDLANQLAACKAFTELMGLCSIASERYEADDIIATLGAAVQKRGHAVAIVTRDKDLGQILKNPDDCLWDFSGDKRVYLHDFNEHYSVLPHQLVDFLALTGDSVDDIPGVPGIGKKTAAALLKLFSSLQSIYDDLPAVAASGLRGAKGIRDKLELYKDQIALSQDLVRLEFNVPLGSEKQLYWQPPTKGKVEAFLADYGLERSLQAQLDRCYWWN
jgi:5'-3' exonuclease